MKGRREVIAQSDIRGGVSVNQGARRVIVNWQLRPRTAQWNEFWRYYFASIGLVLDGHRPVGGDE